MRRKIKKDDTSEPTKKMIILGDNLSHSLENCKVHVKSFPGKGVKYMQDNVKLSLRKTRIILYFMFVQTIYQQIDNRSNLKN